MRVFLSAGEPSGDHHAALLVAALRRRTPDVECVGFGGPHLAAVGCTLVADLTRLAVMWFLRVFVNLHRFVDLARRAERSFLDHRPDVCVLVDFPGFHWWLAWRARRHGIPVVFYCPPQIWAWASWRIGKMRRLVDHVLSALPFEHEWFLAQGMPSTMVGHPFFDEVATDARRKPAAERPLVVLLPGSRGQEITANLDTLLRAAARIQADLPHVRFVVATLHERHARRVRETLSGPSAPAVRVEVESGRAREIIAEARAAIAVSGSVSLELLAARVPTVIVYRIGGVAHVVQSWFRHARYITLVNLLAARDPIGPARPAWWPPRGVPPSDPEAVFPEYLSVADPSALAAADVTGWLADEAAYREATERLEALAARVVRGGSAERAAAAVLALAAGREPVAVAPVAAADAA